MNGLLSARSEIWRHTDGARTGMLPFAFEPGMGFERYVDYALDVPLYFVKRGGIYHEVAGASFRDLLVGRLEALPGERATVSDWANHLSTIFPEVRLKRYLEMRGADVGPPDRICALAALMVGLYYDRQALAAAGELVRGWSRRRSARACATTSRASAWRRASPAASYARSRARRSPSRAAAWRGGRETTPRAATRSIYLAPLDEIVADGRVPAQHWIARFKGAWGGAVDPVFQEAAI